ncbi:MAG: hypothetical protein EXR73_14285 [Myxococcales bacterium]|nr:hypothetical protein [Myxococcales bacterium]
MSFEPRYYRHRGITVLQKRDPALGKTRMRPGRTALVLAGGAVSGGAYKAGGLTALDEILDQRHTPGRGSAPFKLTDFDVFVGLSAGSLVASVLAAGVPPQEILRAVLGVSELLLPFERRDFMWPNYADAGRRLGPFLRREQEHFTNWLSGATDARSADAITLGATLARMRHALPLALPTGAFTTEPLGRYARAQMARIGAPDDFRAAHAATGRSLYLTAVDVNRGHLHVFGHDEPYRAVPISEALRASCSLPGWYAPTRIPNPRAGHKGEPQFFDLVDGGLMRTANVRVAVEKGADLVVCYNPFTPVRYDREGRSLVDHGPVAYASQVFRILLGARLDLAKELLFRDETIDADIIFVEPSEDDYTFFRMNPLGHSQQARAANHGYRTIRAALQSSHERLAEICATHGIAIHAPWPNRKNLPGAEAEVGLGQLTESRGRMRTR